MSCMSIDGLPCLLTNGRLNLTTGCSLQPHVCCRRRRCWAVQVVCKTSMLISRQPTQAIAWCYCGRRRQLRLHDQYLLYSDFSSVSTANTKRSPSITRSGRCAELYRAERCVIRPGRMLPSRSGAMATQLQERMIDSFRASLLDAI